jgi:HlyD family secretion protein
MRSPSRKSRWRTAALTLLVAACDGQSASPTSLATVERSDLVVEVPVHGTLKSLDFEAVNPPGEVNLIWQFKILRMVAEGATVKPGQEVVAFDPSDLEKQLHDAEGELRGYIEELGKGQAEAMQSKLDAQLALADAESKLRKAELKADKPRDLTSQQQLALSAIDRSLADRELHFQEQRSRSRERGDASTRAILQNHIAQAKQSVASLQKQIGLLSVRATRGGTLIYKQNWRGEKRKIGDSVWQGETVIEIASLDRMAAQGQVDEVDSSQLVIGQRVHLRLEAHPDKVYGGRISQVANLVQNESPESRNKVLNLELTLLESDALLMRPGMRFRGRIEIARLPSILQIPLPAVQSTRSGPVVYVETRGGSLQRREVRLGRRSADVVEVLEGLSVGDKVQLGADTRSKSAGKKTDGKDAKGGT